MKPAPVRRIELGPAGVEVEHRPNGVMMLRSRATLGPYPARLTERLLHWAALRGSQTFLAQRGPDGTWRRLTYAQALAQIRAIAQALLDRGLGVQRPLAVLSDNGLEHALLALAAMHVGIPYIPISTGYSLLSSDHAKLRYILSLAAPGAVFAEDASQYGRAIAAAVPKDVELIVARGDAGGRGATPFGALLEVSPTAAVDEAFGCVGPDTIAKVLFTSGSTGHPKGVINTQRMLCCNQQMIIETLPCIGATPPVLVDWLPWNHTFGGNHNFGIVVYNGGSLYIDEGKPVPGLVERSIRNLHDVAPTAYYNVPRGFEALVDYLERDAGFRQHFFSRLQFMFYAGAGLSQPVWDALEDLSVRTCGERILMITGLGSTETAPLATCANWASAKAGHIGLPVAGVEVKLVPVEEKLEARFRGPNITPGYWRSPELTRDAFDEEGFYRMGDAVRFLDPADVQKGLLFDGRVAEDFKLATGTWVSVGPLRAHFIAEGAPFVQDVVIAGHDRDYVAVLVFLYPPACCGKLCADLPPPASLADVARHAAVHAHLQALLDRLAAASTGSARRIARAILLEEPASMDRHEMTDKGSINQRAVLANRAALVEELYRADPSPRTVVARAS